jgi:hypothetical protein
VFCFGDSAFGAISAIHLKPIVSGEHALGKLSFAPSA